MIFLKTVMWALVLAAPAAWAQQAPATGTPRLGNPGVPSAIGRGAADDSPFAASSRERLEKGRQTDRQKRLLADTNRLLALATELKADMEKTTKDTLSIDVIKKAEEIEKLAKSVKDRMRG